MNSLVTGAAVLLALGSLQSPAHAAFSLFEDFEDVVLGSNLANANAGENFEVGNTNATNGGLFTVEASGSDPENNVLSATSFQKGLTGSLGALSIPDLTTGTLFYILQREGIGATPDFNTGLSDLSTTPTTTTNTGLFEAQLNISNNAAAFNVRDGAAFALTQQPFTADTAFGIFQVINNTTDTVQFYYQRPTDPAPILFTGGDNNFSFRNSGTAAQANALTNFLILASGSAASQDMFYVDDIFVDTAGANLVAPVTIRNIPEPSSMSILGLGAMSLAGWRRFRRMA